MFKKVDLLPFKLSFIMLELMVTNLLPCGHTITWLQSKCLLIATLKNTYILTNDIISESSVKQQNISNTE